jgi:hypothetical protein
MGKGIGFCLSFLMNFFTKVHTCIVGNGMDIQWVLLNGMNFGVRANSNNM